MLTTDFLFPTCGNLSGIMAPFIYPTADGPRYLTGHGVTLAMVGMSTLIYAIMSYYFLAIKKRRTVGKEDWKAEGKTEEEVAELGDESPSFIYTY